MQIKFTCCHTILRLALVVLCAQLVNERLLFSAELINKNEAGIALRSYDPVSYFVGDKPLKGRSEFQYDWLEAKWLFASAANRDLFIGDPTKYAPQYGGFCAYAVSKGHTADVNPNIWKVVDGKLYLNKNWLAGKLRVAE